MAEQFESLGEKTKLIEMAARFTNGDVEKAKSMVNGQYNDIIVIKGKFKIITKGYSAIFFAYFNIYDEFIANIDSVIFPNDKFESIRIFDDWKMLNSDFIKLKNSNEEFLDSTDFIDYLLNSFITYDVFPDVQTKNLDSLTSTVKEILGKFYSVSFKELQCQLDLNETNSLELDLEGVDLDVPEVDSADGDETSQPVQNIEPDSEAGRIEAEANYVIPGSVIVSPVKGKYINDIAIGDKIKILLTGNDSLTAKLLDVLNARNAEGGISPIKGRLKAKIPLEKSGYTLYALVAKGVIAKVIEEENVKIQIDSPENSVPATNESSGKIIYLLIGILFLIIIAGSILMILF